MITITQAQAGAREFLNAPKVETVCLLSGHKLEAGEVLAQCGICDVAGCVSCLDDHYCEDYQKDVWIS